MCRAYDCAAARPGPAPADRALREVPASGGQQRHAVSGPRTVPNRGRRIRRGTHPAPTRHLVYGSQAGSAGGELHHAGRRLAQARRAIKRLPVIAGPTDVSVVAAKSGCDARLASPAVSTR